MEGSLPGTSGKVVLVDFWASWCAPCQKSFPFLESLKQKYGKAGLVIVGVSVDDDMDAMKRFLKVHPVSFTIVRDKEHSLAKSVRVSAMPTSVLVDKTGKVEYVEVGFKGSGSEAALQQHIGKLLGQGK